MSTASAPRPGRPWLAPALVGLLLVAVGVVVFLVWFRPKPPKNGPEPDLVGAMAANTRGVVRVERYEYEQGEKEFEEALRLAPGWTPAKVNLGISLLNQQPKDQKTERAPQIVRAQELFREILAAEPDNRHAHYCLGLIAQYFGDFAEAYEHYVTVSKLDPNDPHTWLRVGTTHPKGWQFAEARECYERALKLDPYLYEARYKLSQALLRDDFERGKTMSDEGQRVFASAWFTPSELAKYGEQGKYAEVIGRDPSGKPPVGPIPMFETPAGIKVTLPAEARWATAADLDPLRKAARERFGGTVVLLDYNRDGRPDVLLLSGAVQDGKVRDVLLRNDGNLTFTDVTQAAGLAAPRPSLGAGAADYDNDGFVDLVVTGAGEQHLFRNKGDGTFEDVSAAAGLDKVTGVCLGAGWADLDQDCDLDLVLCWYSESPQTAAGFAGQPTGGGVLLLENIGEARPTPPGNPLLPLTTRFRINEVLGTAAGPRAAVAPVLTDLDGDQDVDVLLLADGADPIPVLNDRLMRFRRGTAAWATGQAHRWNGGLAFVATHAERVDLLLLRADGPPMFLTPAADANYSTGTTNSPAPRQAQAIDLDLDGWTDVVGLAADGPTLLHNQGDGRLENKSGAFGLDRPANVLGLACADLDGDNNPDVVLWSEAGVAVRRSAGNGNKALVVNPTGRRDPSTFMRSNAAGIGVRVAAQAGKHWTAAERVTTAAGLGQSMAPLTLGMGKNENADFIRARWPDGITQVELSIGTGAVLTLEEKSRKTTSCPVLLVWNGERFVYVTDFVGAGAMGEQSADGSTRAPRPEESVHIDSRLMKLKDGHYVLKVTEPMDEVGYVDHLQLDVVDHPAGVSVFPDERFATSDPPPTQELLAFRDRRFPRKATDHRGRDVTKLVLDRDRRAPEGFHLRSWIGFAEDHSVTFDFGDLPVARRWYLVAASWTEYPYPESIFAAERAGVPLQFPVLERLAADGKTWEPLGDLGFPAGLPRVMTRPLPDLKPGPCTLRVRTNMQVFFDQVFLAPAEDVGLKVHSLSVTKADLAARGFLQEVFPDGRPPLAYDDGKTEAVPIAKWKGKVTRLGDVTELLTAADDRFVLCGPGDEIVVRFDATKLPPLPAGWERSFVLRARGYSKDTGVFTATAGHVMPLPFRAMKNYPDFGGAKAPATDADKWHTRPVGGR